MDDGLKAAIESVVDERYAENPGPATLNVVLIARLVEERLGRSLARKEVEVACDELVAEDRIVFLRDHGKDGRRYCSTDVPEATVELLREGSV